MIDVVRVILGTVALFIIMIELPTGIVLSLILDRVISRRDSGDMNT